MNTSQESTKFSIRKGVIQGDTISSKLLTASLEGVFRKLDLEKTRIQINGEYSIRLRFANDPVLLSDSREDLHRRVEELRSESLVVGVI